MTITVADCRHLVGEFYRIPKGVMLSRTRVRNVARPRQMAMTLAREMTDASFPAIGRHFNIKDHTTALKGRQRIYELERENARVRSAMANFRIVLLTFKAQREVTLMGEGD